MQFINWKRKDNFNQTDMSD